MLENILWFAAGVGTTLAAVVALYLLTPERAIEVDDDGRDPLRPHRHLGFDSAELDGGQ